MILPVAPPEDQISGTTSGFAYFTKLRLGVDGFVARYFSLRGSLLLHRHAVGGDILRAPVNVMLSPLLVLTRILAALCGILRLRRAARWLRGRRVVLRTRVAAHIEAAVVADLLGVRLPHGTSLDSAGLSREILAAPQFRSIFRNKENVEGITGVSVQITTALAEYSGARSAVADITNALLALVIGGLVFHAVTPGMISMAPTLANALALETAVANFPLGQTAGAMWYGVFPAATSAWLLAANVAGLLMLGSVLGAFAGIVADPIQTHLGIHRRRLLRLVDAIEDNLVGTGTKHYTAREHFYARFVDVWDALLSALRIFRS
ncbi:MAG: DUF6635 family protein [Sulfitobacter sp.]